MQDANQAHAKKEQKPKLSNLSVPDALNARVFVLVNAKGSSVNLFTNLEKQFSQHSNPEIAQKQKAYLRNQFEFFGIAKPDRAQIEKEVIKKSNIKTEQELISAIKNLWAQDKREFHYAAMNLALAHKKLWTHNILHLFEFMIRTHSWWDTVDFIAPHLVGRFLESHPQLITKMDEWITDEYLWIRRAALIFQLRWKHNTNQELLFGYCTKTAHEKDFFIRKAIGWTLRQYSKTNPQAVKKYIQENGSKLSPLSLKEASKYIDRTKVDKKHLEKKDFDKILAKIMKDYGPLLERLSKT